MMAVGEYYSVRDLVNLSGQPGSSVADVMNFLSKYGFVRSFGQPGGVFTKAGSFSPSESIQLLKTLLPSIQN